jgi:ribosomal protein L37E
MSRQRGAKMQEQEIKCRCGRKLVLWSAWLNTCSNCGQDYNGFGQALAPRSQWGEETGEHPADVAMGGYTDYELAMGLDN